MYNNSHSPVIAIRLYDNNRQNYVLFKEIEECLWRISFVEKYIE